jgi:uncharacterized membrane protein
MFMPNLLYMFVSFVYHLALALWIGGAVALGALTAPELFRQLPRSEAGGIFGPILRRFSRVRLVAIVFAIAAAFAKYLLWETHARSAWIAARALCLLALAAIVMWEIAGIEPRMGRLRATMTPADDDPSRRAFMRLHRQSEALMKVSLAVALAAVFLS